MTTTPPPTSPDFDPSLVDFPEPPVWPKVIGIISIVWGTIGLGCNACGLASPILTNMFSQQMEQQMGEPMPDVMKINSIQLGMIGVGLLMAVFLLFAGIMTVMRKPAGRMMHLVYAVVSVVMTLVGTGYGYVRMQDMAQWLAANGGSKWAQQANPAYQWIGLGVGVLLGLAWPVFCLVWFGLVKRKAEDMTGGVEAPAA